MKDRAAKAKLAADRWVDVKRIVVAEYSEAAVSLSFIQAWETLTYPDSLYKSACSGVVTSVAVKLGSCFGAVFCVWTLSFGLTDFEKPPRSYFPKL